MVHARSRNEFEWETPPMRVKGFSGSTAECASALKLAGKSQAEALAIINQQVDNAVKLLRKAARDLEPGRRTSATRALFQKIFRVAPEFVPSWFTPRPGLADRGDVVRLRLSKVADLLAGGRVKFFCAINGTNCPDCAGSTGNEFACSSWGQQGVAPKNSRVICLGTAFWADMKTGRVKSMLSTIMHEPFHIYFGKVVTAHVDDPGKFGGINCTVRFVFEANKLTAPDRVNQRCDATAARGGAATKPKSAPPAPSPNSNPPAPGDIFDWFPSWFPSFGSGAKIVDRTAFAKKSNRKGQRPPQQVYALVLHQTAFSRGNHEDKYDGIPVHFVILPNGTIVQLHPEAEYLWSSNGFNHGSVAVEFVGNFRSVRGRHYKPEKFGCHRPTPEQIQAGRELIKHLQKKIGLTTVLAHRQSSNSRENDPGPEVWYSVGQWAVDNLGLKDGGPGFKVGDGHPIPDTWRQWGSASRSHPVHSSTLQECKSLYRT